MSLAKRTGQYLGQPWRKRRSRNRRNIDGQLTAPIPEQLEVRNLLAAFVVDTVVDESDGDMSAGDLSLREAIETANAQAGADTITFDPSVFGSAQTIDLLLGQFAVTDEVTITGPGQDLLTIDAQQNSRHFFIDDSDESMEIAVVISDLTLLNGLSTDGNDPTESLEEAGGAVFSAEDIHLSRMRLIQNETLSGGGAVFSSGTAKITESHLESNVSRGSGAGVYNGAMLDISSTNLISNTAGGGGGGVFNFGEAIASIRRASISQNRASGGGGIANAGAMTVHDSLIHENTAGSGGGIGNNGSLTIANSTIVANRVASEGGGISHGFRKPEISIMNSTIANNRAGAGGGISYSSPIKMENTIVVDNIDNVDEPNDLETMEFLFGGVVSGLHNLIGDPATSGDLVHGVDGNIVGQTDGNGGREGLDVATVLAPLADNGGATLTHALVAGSPAIDAGDPDFDGASFDPPITSDQRGEGFDRVVDGNGDGTARIDIGAFESPLLPNLLLSESDDTTVVNEAGTDTIEVSLSRQPSQSVVVDVSIGTPTVISSDTAQLTFTSQNWDQPQQITLSGIQDDDETGPLATSVILAVDDASSDDEFDGLTTTVDVTFQDDDGSLRGNVDGDSDFDANDAFLIHLVQLSGGNSQIDQSKGASPLSAAEIRSAIDGLLTAADVDEDGDTDASDSFLIQLVKLSGSNTQIDQSKGASSLSAQQIRDNVDALGGNQGADTQRVASANPVLAAVAAEDLELDRLFETFGEDWRDDAVADSQTVSDARSAQTKSQNRNWLTVLRD